MLRQLACFAISTFHKQDLVNCLQIDVLVDSLSADGGFLGRTQWDAPDVDPFVFLTETEDESLPPLEIGQMRRCVVDSAMLFDLEAHPVS